MFRRSRLALLFCTLEACSSANHDAPHVQGEPSLPAATASDLQQTLDGVVAANVAPGVSLFLDRPGYAPWSGASGLADLDTRAALTPAARCRAGSILKMAVAIAVLELVEQGRLDLDATLSDLLPSDVVSRIANGDAITLRMLLEHTSGVPDWNGPDFHALVAQDTAHVWSFDELIDRAVAKPVPFAPGAGWAYSNTDYTLIGAILERATGEPWRNVVRERVFARVGMKATVLPEEGNVRCDGCSRGYDSVEGTLVDLTEIDPSMAGAAGGDALVTTPADLAKLAGALMAGELFDDPRTLELMLDFTDAPLPEQAQTGYALGIARFEVNGVELIGHLGGTAGFQSFVFYEPNSGATMSGYMNTTGNFAGFVLPALGAIGRALGVSPTP
jgi:D-alanyl-D-alanine carboxypeptidase